MVETRLCRIAVSAILSVSIAWQAHAQQTENNDEIVVSLLGTGSPELNPKRFGPSTLVQAGGLNLLFDAGRGSSIRMAQVSVPPGEIDAIFLSHFHSDHVNGLTDLWMAGYMLNNPSGGRQSPLRLYGGVGLDSMTEHMALAFRADTIVRTEGRGAPPGSMLIIAQEIADDGVIFEQSGVKVTAFTVTHIDQSYGYRVDYEGRSVLLSGDTSFDENLIEHGRNVDLLIHQVRMMAPDRDNGYHTSPEEAGTVFARTNTKMGVYSHIILTGFSSTDPQAIQELVARTRTTYEGPLTVGSDLLRFTVGDEIGVDRNYVVQ